MANDVFDFHWTIPEAGFHWRRAPVLTEDGTAAKPQWVLTNGLATGAQYRMKRYPPLRMFNGLFRTLAQTPPTRDGILAFAQQYGQLGMYVPLHITAPDDPTRLLGLWGETEGDWVKQIVSLRRAVEIWDLARTQDTAGLGRFLQWKQAGVGEYWIYDSHPDLPSPQEDWRRAFPPPPGRFQAMVEPVMDFMRPDDVVTAAQFLVQRWINEHIEGRVSPRVVYHLDLNKPVLRFVPKDLLGAVWLQLAQAIDADKENRACKECGKWFEISLEGDGRTKRRQFCSEPCKSKEYRRRRDRTGELHAAGRDAREIADELQTALGTIKKWLRRRKK